jgi:hypothetical protein
MASETNDEVVQAVEPAASTEGAAVAEPSTDAAVSAPAPAVAEAVEAPAEAAPQVEPVVAAETTAVQEPQQSGSPS